MVKQVTSYGCSYCDKIYSNSSSATKHEKKCKVEHDKLKLVSDKQKIINEYQHDVRLNLANINDLENAMNEHFIKIFGEEGRKIEFKVRIDSRIDNISCSHYAPIGKQTNWGGRQTDNDGNLLPDSYLGWRGEISFQYSELSEILRKYTSSSFTSKISNIIRGINTGSGGGGQYSIYLFVDDFPLIQEVREKNSHALDQYKLEAEFVVENAKKLVVDNLPKIEVLRDAVNVEQRIIKIHQAKVDELKDQIECTLGSYIKQFVDEVYGKNPSNVEQFDNTELSMLGEIRRTTASKLRNLYN